ncbi:MAG: dihydrofolate reductase [Planctomycetota bacterium]
MNAQAGEWTLVVAIAKNGIIGIEDRLPWRLSSDLQRFKKMTMGNCLLMGRKTFESIGKALPGRQTIVLSRSGFEPGDPSIAVVSEFDQVDEVLEEGRCVMVVGGSQIYQAAVKLCSEIWLTRVEAEVEGDTYFPELNWSNWERVSSESFPAGPKDEFETSFEVWKRGAP